MFDPKNPKGSTPEQIREYFEEGKKAGKRIVATKALVEEIAKHVEWINEYIEERYSGADDAVHRKIRRTVLLEGMEGLSDLPMCPICDKSHAGFNAAKCEFILACSTECKGRWCCSVSC